VLDVNKWNTRVLAHPFQYHSPTTVEEACSLLSELEGAMAFAGGTDLIPKAKQALIRPRHLVNLKRIPELTGIREEDGLVWIGAATKLRALEKSKLVSERLPLLHQAVSSIGSVQIRNMGTLGGNVCNASPAADGALALVALGAEVEVAGASERRSHPIEEFFRGPGKTILERGELVVGFRVRPHDGYGQRFTSIGRMSLDISTVSVAAALKRRGDRVEEARLAMGSVAPIPLRLHGVEEYLRGRVLDDGVVWRAAELASQEIRPITDIRGTAEYRREACKGLVMDALKACWLEAGVE